MNYYLWISGAEHGPYTVEQIRDGLADGTIDAQQTARAEDSAEWKQLSEFVRVSPVANSFANQFRETALKICLRHGRVLAVCIVAVVAFTAAFQIGSMDGGSAPSSSSSKAETSEEFGYLDGRQVGFSDARTRKAKMGAGTMRSVAAQRSVQLGLSEKERKDYEAGWCIGYSKGYDSYSQ